MNDEPTNSGAIDAEYECAVRRPLPPRSISLELLRRVERALLALADGSRELTTRLDVNGQYESESLRSLDQWEHRPSKRIRSVTFTVEGDAFEATVDLSRETRGWVVIASSRPGMRSRLEAAGERIAPIIEGAALPDASLDPAEVDTTLSLPAITVNLTQLQLLREEIERGLRNVIASSTDAGDVIHESTNWGVASALGRTLYVRTLSELPFELLGSPAKRITLSVEIETESETFAVTVDMRDTYCNAELRGKGPVSARIARELSSIVNTYLEGVQSSQEVFYKRETLIIITMLFGFGLVGPILPLLITNGRYGGLFLANLLLGYILLIAYRLLTKRMYPYCSFNIVGQRPPRLGPWSFVLVLVALYLVPTLVALTIKPAVFVWS